MENINEKILELFKTMINDIMEVYPEEKGNIYEKYESIMNLEILDIDDCELIQDFLEKINEKSSLITNKDLEVIQDDFIDGIPLKRIWGSGISDATKNNIWKYLQTFCIININLNSSKELQQFLSGETKEINRENKKDIKDLKKIKKLKESINDINEENKEKDQLEQSQMGNIFESTGIGQLAKEIAEGIDFEEMMGKEDNKNSDIDNNEQSMESVMQNIMNPGNFMNLFTNINEKVQEKISTGALSEDMLTGEANNLYGNFQNNPMFQSMMNNPELKKFQEQMTSTEQQGEKEKSSEKEQTNNNPERKENAIKEARKNKEVRVKKLDHKEPIVAKNKTQERLQKKLAQREEEKKIKLNTEQKKTEKTDNIIVEKTE